MTRSRIDGRKPAIRVNKVINDREMISLRDFIKEMLSNRSLSSKTFYSSFFSGVYQP